MLLFEIVRMTNVLKTKINYPPVITIFIGGINHCQMSGL